MNKLTWLLGPALVLGCGGVEIDVDGDAPGDAAPAEDEAPDTDDALPDVEPTDELPPADVLPDEAPSADEPPAEEPPAEEPPVEEPPAEPESPLLDELEPMEGFAPTADPELLPAPRGAHGGDCSLGDWHCPAESCMDVKAERRHEPSGPFWLDTDGFGPLDPLQVWCDLETDGGGWILVASYRRNEYDAGGFLVTQTRRMDVHGGGPATPDWFPSPDGEGAFGHLPYERFPPRGKEVAFACGSDRHPEQFRYTTSRLFESWAPGIKGQYGTVGEPGWGVLAADDREGMGRDGFGVCGEEDSDRVFGIGVCSGFGERRSRRNHLASVSHDAEAGTMIVSCDGSNATRMKVWVR